MNGITVRQSPGRKGTPRAEPKSKLPQTVAEVLGKHVTLEVESVDRMYLNAIVPRLQIVEGTLRFTRKHADYLRTLETRMPRMAAQTLLTILIL